MTGQYTELYFPSHNVRYIAIDDGVDSEKGESEIAPFKNIINEWVARDTSRKVKSAFKTKFAEGAYYGAYAPLGYKKHPDIKGKLLVLSLIHICTKKCGNFKRRRRKDRAY